MAGKKKQRKRDTKNKGYPKGKRAGKKQKSNVKVNKPDKSAQPHIPNTAVPPEKSGNEDIRLNKYIAHSGLCSRRDADTLIEEGRVTVNDKPVKEMGVKVSPADRVKVDGQTLQLESYAYLLMNKPKDTITTTSDEKDRKTVVDIVGEATGKRLYPVGRLDRNTTGALLLTNDGDLAHRLMHPRYKVKKVYELVPEKILSDEEVSKLIEGIELEDGLAKAHQIRRSGEDPSMLEITLLEGRNRQLRRMMEALGTGVKSLKRVKYAGLDLKGVRIGRWRTLRRKEVHQVRKMVKLDPLDFN